MSKRYLPTGNEQISLPTIDEGTAAIEGVSFLHMGFKGLVEQRGSADQALMEPFFSVDCGAAPLTDLRWARREYWVPEFTARADSFTVAGVILAPVGERGFLYRLEVTNGDNVRQQINFGLRGTWASAWHCVNEDKALEGAKRCYPSNWNHSLIFDMRCGAPLFAFAPMADAACESTFEEVGGAIRYALTHSANLAPGQKAAVTFYWGFGFEEVAAATSAKEMLRQGFDYELSNTVEWLQKRIWWCEDEKLRALYNTNLFFCLFFSTGVTLDTEELVLVTSRSPRYYVSAAYWDRDSLLWSFPAVLDVDRPLARKMLEYVFGRQRRNLGVHSRYIDGTVLEPGFELDELMAPLLALERYGDAALLEEPNVLTGIQEILEKLADRRSKKAALYETFLQPTDDERVYPYLTYDNVLVWKGLNALAKLSPARYGYLAELAEETRAAILEHCVKGGYFAWSVDLEGNHDVYDEPPGSLLLLAHLGFCAPDDPLYLNTVRMIRSSDYKYSFHGCGISDIGCPHAPHPWMLSVGNSLLSGEVERSLDILRKVTMDNGIVCESVDEHTGACTTGEAFATCAGFVCHALRAALKEGAK